MANGIARHCSMAGNQREAACWGLAIAWRREIDATSLITVRQRGSLGGAIELSSNLYLSYQNGWWYLLLNR